MGLQDHTDAVFWQNLNSNTDILMKNVTIADYLQSLFFYKCFPNWPVSLQ